jgi:hypothetical protein
MKQRLLVSLLTVLVFAAGFGARVWTEGQQPVPPPPIVGREFTGLQSGEKPPAPSPKPYNRAELVADIEKLRPQVDAYRTQVDAIDNEYEQAFVKILNPEQRKIYDKKIADMQKRRADREAKEATSPPPPLSDEEIAKLRQRPFESVFYKVCTSAKLEQVAHDFKLDAEQQARERELLVARRDKFLALLDSTPVPTIRITWLAPLVQRLGEPAKPAAK